MLRLQYLPGERSFFLFIRAEIGIGSPFGAFVISRVGVEGVSAPTTPKMFACDPAGDPRPRKRDIHFLKGARTRKDVQRLLVSAQSNFSFRQCFSRWFRQASGIGK